MIYSNPTKPDKEVFRRIEETWSTPYLPIEKDVYPVINKKFGNYPEIDHIDGIGTKGIYYWQKRTFGSAAIDALAMNLNDLVLVLAIPYKLQNHILIPKKDNEAVLEIIGALVDECKKRNIAITGGETSIQNNLDGLDITITVSGFIKHPKSNKFEIGDLLVGFRSNGLHANGFTKVREVLGDDYRPEYISPTLIYFDTVSAFNEKYEIHGMMHITGGAYTKLKDLLGSGADAKINRNHRLLPQPIFNELYEKDISDEEIYRTFNCGIGFIVSVSPKDAEKIISQCSGQTDVIGEVVSGSGKVKIESAFSEREIEF